MAFLVARKNVLRAGIPPDALGDDDDHMGTTKDLVIEDTGDHRVASTARLLLFAGRHDQPGRGAADLAGWFDSEVEAWTAFGACRGTTSDDDGWAELVTVDVDGRPSLLAWFGRAASPISSRAAAGRRHHPAGRGAGVARRHLSLVVG